MTIKSQQTATRTHDDDTRKIEITLNRYVSESTRYLDGYEMGTETSTWEEYQVTITSKKTGAKLVTSGKPGDFAFFEKTDSKFYKNLPAGTYARISNAYISQDLYDIAMSMIAELDAELSTDQDYNDLKSAEVAKTAKAKHDEGLVDQVEAADNAARQNHPGWCNKCQSYCYGDCDSN